MSFVYAPGVRCYHCYQPYRDHPQLKCLWGPQQFRPLSCGACSRFVTVFSDVWTADGVLPPLPMHGTCTMNVNPVTLVARAEST